MFNRTIKYAKLAWVYAKGICGFRHRVYDLKFVYVPEDKLWYIDMPWPCNRYNLAMVAGSNHLLNYLDFKREHRVRVLVRPSKKKRTDMTGYFECAKQYSGLFAGATYKVIGLPDFTKEIWICPVTLTVLGHYPQYIYIEHLNIDGTPVDKDKYFEELLNTKFVDLNLSVRLLNKLNKMGIVTISDYLCKSDIDMKEFGTSRFEIEDLMEALNLN